VTEHEPPGGIADLSAMLRRAEDVEPEPVSPKNATRLKRRRWVRLLTGLIVTVVVIALVATYVSLTLSAPVGAAAATVHRPDVAVPAAAAIVMPQVGEAAVSISGGDDYLGSTADGIFDSSGGNSPMPMASISKLVTAMVILNSKPLGASGTGPTIIWTKAQHDLYDKYYLLNATIAAMPTGSAMSEHDALETMLVVSACNYAEALADWAFGSNAGFISATKKWLKAHGLTGTTMIEPTGVDAQNTSTPSDLIAIGKLAMADPAIAAIVAKTSLDVPSLAGMPNTNDLLGSDGIDGIKTGTLIPGGSDLLFSAVVPVGAATPLTVTGVMLGGDSRASVDSAVRSLITSITSGFHEEQLATEGDVIGSYSTPWGAKASMILGKSASTLTWSNTPITSTMTTTTLKTGASGEKVGSVTYVAGKSTVTVPVVLKGKIQGPTTWWRLTHPMELLGK
jgi:serine-type D-Ala-D-Ala carboxypeptidase (penicillin-binding protein 5/6)